MLSLLRLPRTLTTSCFVLALLALSNTACAQESNAFPQIGARVRLTTWSETRHTGLRSDTSEQSLTLQHRGGPVVIPFTSIQRLEVPAGTHTNALNGLIISLPSGAGIGALIAAATYKPCQGLACVFNPTDQGQAALWGAAAGTILGSIIGPIVGHFVHTDTWVTVTPLRIRSSHD